MYDITRVVISHVYAHCHIQASNLGIFTQTSYVCRIYSRIARRNADTLTAVDAENNPTPSTAV